LRQALAVEGEGLETSLLEAGRALSLTHGKRLPRATEYVK
jgi:hypothetical protein